MIKPYFVFLILLTSILFISCSKEDKIVTPEQEQEEEELSDIKGDWKGEYKTLLDTIMYECDITESKGEISGRAELTRVHYKSGFPFSDEYYFNRTSVTGTYTKPDMNLKFKFDKNIHFEGKVADDLKSIVGHIKAYRTNPDSVYIYKMVLTKTI